MRIRIQTPIRGIQYSVNEREFNTEWLTKEEIRQKVQEAREVWDIIESVYSQPSSVADFQLVTEYDNLKKVVEQIQILSEQKSVFLESLKSLIWEKEYNDVISETIKSNKFKKITLHTNETKE